jgi:hypothetical protein
MLGQDAGLAQQRHEVGVGAPPRDDVQMDVVLDAGARHLPLVHAEVEPFRRVGFPYGSERLLHQPHHVEQDRLGQVLDRRDMPIRRNQEVAVVVRVDVHDHVGVATAP